MRKTFAITALLLCILPFIAHAQVMQHSITGSILSIEKKPLDGASISLLKYSDSTLITNTLTDTNGVYHFTAIKKGTYFIAATTVGFKKGYAVVEINTADVLLQSIVLLPEEKSLKGITITSKKPPIEWKLDRTVVNVDATVTNAGLSALEVLQKTPGVSVDKDGNINLKGKSGVQIYIDGKQTYLSEKDLSNFLRNMNAAQLSQIEIMTNPPAKYDAAGNSGIINIKTKKLKAFGYNGSLTSNFKQGYFFRHNESFNFNYRNKLFNFFVNGGYAKWRSKQKLFLNKNFIDPITKNITSSLAQQASMFTNDDDDYLKIGVEYFATKRTTIGITIHGDRNPSTWKSFTNTNLFTSTGIPENRTIIEVENAQKWKSISTNLSFTTKFDSSGQEITFNLDYLHYNNYSFQPLLSKYYAPTNNALKSADTLLGNLLQKITVYSTKADYTLPLKNNAKLEAGFKASFVTTDNDAKYDSLINNFPIPDAGRSNHFRYTENINAVYLNYSRPLSKKITGQFGLRLENTISNGQQLTAHSNFKRNSMQLFPTAYIQYSANENNQFVLNYGKRIDRPNYKSLNPFSEFVDRYTVQKGNPDLKAQISNNIELIHTFKNVLNTTLNFCKTTDIILDIIQQNNITQETIIRKENIASQQQIGLSLSASSKITKWWSGNINVSIRNNKFKGIVENESISVKANVFEGQFSNEFNWKKGWSAEVNGYYSGKSLWGISFIKPLCQISAGVAKQVLHEKATIKLSFNDIFNGGIYNISSKYSTTDLKIKNFNLERSATLSFTWRFHKGTLKAERNNKINSAVDEQKRVK